MKIEAKEYLSLIDKDFNELSENCMPLWHPLGFVSCVIKKDDKHTVRIHCWPKGERRVKNPDWPIHTHCYHLSSYIVSGSIQDIKYKTGSGDEHAVYAVKYTGDDSEISQTTSHIKIEELTNEKRTSGECYEVERGVFHQSIVPIAEEVITIVVLSEFDSTPPLVLGHRSQKKYPYDRAPFDKNIFWNNVSKAINENQ